MTNVRYAVVVLDVFEICFQEKSMFKKPNNVDCLDSRTLYPGGYKEMSYTVSLLTNSALVYEPKCGGRGRSCGVSAN